MMQPLVSIGLLTYNHERYIADALEGMLSQKYERIELIILDDASDDGTPQVIRQYLKRLKEKFVRVVYLRNEKNNGNIPHNCNRMIMESEGDLYYEISGDDILLPDGIQLLCKALTDHPEYMVVHANRIQISDSYSFGDEIDITHVFQRNKYSGVESNNLFQRLMYSNCIAAPTVMLRKDVFHKHGYHDESIAYEDYEYWLRISQTERFYYLDKPVILYRRAETSMTTFYEKCNNDKLQTAMEADFLAKEKYIERLKRSDQKTCWQAYYSYYARMCTQYGYQEGNKWLDDKMTERDIELDERQADYKKLFERHWKEAEILADWIGIKKQNVLGNYLRNRQIQNVAIYGYSRLGRVLQKELLQDGIHINYIIDRKGEMMQCSYPVYTIDDNLPLTDAIIVAPAELYENVKPVLNQKINVKVIALSQMVEELRIENESKRPVP